MKTSPVLAMLPGTASGSAQDSSAAAKTLEAIALPKPQTVGYPV